MKKNLKLLLSIPLYFLLVIFNNCRSMVYNIRHDINFFNNVEFFNVAILVSIIVFVIIMILRNKSSKNNKILVSSLIVILGTSLLNGIFVDKNISMFIVVYFYLLFISFVTMIITKQKFEISLVLGVSVLLLFMTVLGIFNLLFLVKYLIIVFIVVGLIIIFYNIKNKKFDETLQKLNCYGIVVFSTLFLIAVCGGINRYVHTYDEYSHWAFDAKAVINYDKLSTCQEVVSRTRAYPPILTLWHYFINLFIGTFIEQNLYIGLSLIITVFLMPIFSFIEKKNRILLPLLLIAIPFSCYLFGGVYGYGTLYADFAFSAIFSASLVFYLYYRNSKNLFKYLAITLSILALTKPTGFMLAGTFIFILFIIDLFKENNYEFNLKKILKNFFKILLKWCKLLFLVVGIFVLWRVYVKISDNFVNDFFDYKLVPTVLETSLEYKTNKSVIFPFVSKLFKSFDNTLITGIIKISLWQFILIIFTVLAILFCFDNDYNNKSKINDDNKKKLNMALGDTISFLLGYVLFFILNIISMFVMFTVYETQELASFERYLNGMNFALLIFIIAYASFISLKFSRKKIYALAIVMVMFIINIPFNRCIYFISDYKERENTKEISYSRQEKVRVINENTPQDAMVFVLDQQEKDGIMAMWYTRYYSFPRKVNASSEAITWKIRTDKNGDDLGDWGLTAEKLIEHLKDYKFDYLFLYSIDDLAFEKLSPYFNDIDKSKECELFKINVSDDKVSLIPIA